MWQQEYIPLAGSLGLSTFVAALPIIAALVIIGFLGGYLLMRRQPARP